MALRPCCWPVSPYHICSEYFQRSRVTLLTALHELQDIFLLINEVFPAIHPATSVIITEERMSLGTQKGLCSLSPMGFNLTLLTSLVTKSHYHKWLMWNVLVSVNYEQTVVCMTKPPSQMVLFLGSPKHRQGQYSWTETSAKAQGEQTLSFVLIHFQ